MLESGKRIKSSLVVLCQRLMMIGIIFLAMLINNAGAQETMQFESEAKKLDFIRQMLKKEKHLRLDEYSNPRCKQMMKDLLAGKNFKAIEPYMRADSEDDPRLARWNQCRQKDYHEVSDDPAKFFGALNLLGGPPYRFYRIELDGNKKNGPEEMVYYQKPSDPNGIGDTGYSWVDPKNCELKGGFPVAPPAKDNAFYLNTLIFYKGKLWVIEYEERFSFSLQRRVDSTKWEICRWRLFDPKKANEYMDNK